MQNKEKNCIKDDLIQDKNIQTKKFKLNSQKNKFYDENQIYNEFMHENNFQVIKPVPMKKSINESKDNFFLSKKRARSKGLFQYNNLYKNNGENENNCAFQSLKVFDKPKIQLNPLIYPNIILFNENSLNLNIRNGQVNKKFMKHKKTKIKINVIINNYRNIDETFLKDREEDNNKKILFGISNHKTIINKFDMIKTQNSSNTKISNKIDENNKSKLTPRTYSKKFEIIKSENLDENDNLNYNIIRKIPKNKKRGRKPQKESKRLHNALDQDNIIRKIQVHFLTFITYFCNDLIQAILPNNKDLNFKNINYELKKTVNHAYIEKLKSKNIGDILQLKASPKNKKFDSNINKITFDKICCINPFLKKFFEISYLNMFNSYYINNERELEVEGHNIKLSPKTRLFIDLIEKNKSSEKKIKEVAEQYFINKRKDLNKLFVIQKE